MWKGQVLKKKLFGILIIPFLPKIAGSNPAKAVGFFGRNILSTPSFEGEVKPSVPSRRFAACLRPLEITWKSDFQAKFVRPFLAHFRSSLPEGSNVA
jgi:hypothetical protein